MGSTFIGRQPGWADASFARCPVPAVAVLPVGTRWLLPPQTPLTNEPDLTNIVSFPSRHVRSFRSILLIAARFVLKFTICTATASKAIGASLCRPYSVHTALSWCDTDLLAIGVENTDLPPPTAAEPVRSARMGRTTTGNLERAR